jgi:CHAT domain-containing protein
MKVALVEFFVGENKTSIFVIDPRKPTSVKQPWLTEVDIGAEDIQAATTLIWNFGKNSLVVDSNLAFFQELGNRLLGPVIEYLGDCDVLYLIPHKALHHLPLHAVNIGGKLLAEYAAIIYLPSASLLRFCQMNNLMRRQKEYSYEKALVMGVGTKEDKAVYRKQFSEEAHEVSSLFPETYNQCFTGLRATKQVFLDRAPDAGLIHIASHGFFNEKEPLGSGLLLAHGRTLPSLRDPNEDRHILKAKAFYHLRLTANLVVLNGCLTGMSEVRAGDELFGLARGLFAAGVPTVVLCLWQAHHGAARYFMKSFYHALLSGSPKALAFQEAQRRLRADSEFEQVRYWAPFVLLGDWL